MVANGIHPVARILNLGKLLDFNRGMADDFQQLFVGPDVVLMGSDI